METAIRWSPTSTPDDQRFLYVDVAGRSFKTCKVRSVEEGSNLKYDVLSSRFDVPAFRSFDWSPVDEGLVAVGQSSGEATVLHMNDDSQSPVVFPARNQRYCNSVSFNTQGLLAAGLDKVRNDFCLNVWDLNQRVPLSRNNARGAGPDRQAVEPLRKFASSEPITSVKFFKSQPETFVAGVKGQYVRTYDLREANSNPVLQFSTHCVHNLAIDWLDENYIASCFPTTDAAAIYVWDRRAGSRYPITAVMSSSDTSNLSPALEFKQPVTPGSSIWSLRFSRIRRGCLGMLSSAGEFKNYDIAKEYVSDEYRSSLEHTFGQDSANSPEPIYTKNVRVFRRHSQLQNQEDPNNQPRVTAFDFLNYDMSNTPSAVTLLSNRDVAMSFLPTSPRPMDLSSQSVLARAGFAHENPTVKFSSPSFEPGTTSSEVVREIRRSANPEANLEGSPDAHAVRQGGGPLDAGVTIRTEINGLPNQGKPEDGPVPFADVLAGLTIPRLRTKEGYLLDSEKNKRILSDDPALLALWEWIGSARSRSMGGGMVIRGVDMNYLGVYNVWNGFLGQSFENRVASFDSKKSEINVSALVKELTRQAEIPKAKTCSTKSPEQRQLCLRICGAKESTQELETAVNQLVSDGESTKAAALAIFQDERKLAYNTLRQHQPTQAHKTLAMAIVGSSKGATDPDWEETCAEIAKELTDPYARAILALVSKGNWHAVIDEATLPLRYRVEVALRWLPDYELTIFLRQATIEVTQAGNVEGVVLTGLDHGSLELFQSYINKYNDIQTPVLAMSHAIPRFITDAENKARFEAWCKTYRRRVNSWKLHLERARFDVETSKLAATWDGRKLVNPPPQQVSLVCNYCTRPLSQQQQQQQQDNMDSPAAKAAGPETVHLTAGHPLGPASMTGTVCPRCGRQMPRCGICSLWLGSPDPMSRASIADDAKKEPRSSATLYEVMKRFVVFCINCNHGFHADHARSWFVKHRVCPVAECNCICDR